MSTIIGLVSTFRLPLQILSIYRLIFDYQYRYTPLLSYKPFKYATIDRYHDIIIS